MKRADGPTPAGGSYSEARGFDASGLETDDFSAATHIRIDEFDDDGRVIQRSYAGPMVDDTADRDAALAVTVTAGEANDPYNTDMAQSGTWDVRHPRDQRVVDNILDLVDVLLPDRDAATLRRDLAALTAVPSWERAPARLRAEVAEFLAG